MKQNVIIILDANRRRELFCYWFTHGSIIEKDQQLIGLFKNIRDSAIMLILSREVKKQRDLDIKKREESRKIVLRYLRLNFHGCQKRITRSYFRSFVNH